jgi:hypothetical protein
MVIENQLPLVLGLAAKRDPRFAEITVYEQPRLVPLDQIMAEIEGRLPLERVIFPVAGCGIDLDRAPEVPIHRGGVTQI